MADRRGRAVVGSRHGRVEPAIQPLPLRPEPIDVAVQEEEERISAAIETLEIDPPKLTCAEACGLLSIIRNAAIRIPECQCLRIGGNAGGSVGGLEKRPPIDPLYAVGRPELQTGSWR